MGEGALNVPVCAELGMDVAGSLVVLAGRKSKFLIWVKRGSCVMFCSKSPSPGLT
jgi:hypothetical protein